MGNPRWINVEENEVKALAHAVGQRLWADIQANGSRVPCTGIELTVTAVPGDSGFEPWCLGCQEIASCKRH